MLMTQKIREKNLPRRAESAERKRERDREANRSPTLAHQFSYLSSPNGRRTLKYTRLIIQSLLNDPENSNMIKARNYIKTCIQEKFLIQRQLLYVLSCDIQFITVSTYTTTTSYFVFVRKYSYRYSSS